MRYVLIALSMLLGPVTSAHAQISVGIGLPGVDIGINMATYPELVPVPGYPVYYDPRANSNYFFYDGLYWVYQGDNWYSSSWYNGPWQQVGPEYVPLFVLRVPVRYYRQPPAYFRGWSASAPPRWGEHWGHDWEQRRTGWDRWDRRSAPRPAPLPVYQRQYSGDRYPRAPEQQQVIRSEKYRYQPREAVTQQHYQQQGKPGSSRAEPQQQAPAKQRPQQQAPVQQRPQQQAPVQQRPQQQAPMQQRSSTQQQHMQPSEQRQQARPMQPQMQRSQAAPQGKGKENKAASQDKGRENRKE